MKLLITGALGQVGRELSLEASAQGFEVVALSSTMLDITCSEAVFEAVKRHRPDIIFNCAAYTNVDKAETDLERCFNVNATACKYLSEAANSVEARLIHLSTDYVFDGLNERGYYVTDQPNPQNVYGQSKLKGEEYIASLCKSYLICRVAWVFGEHGSNFVKTMLNLAKTKSELSVVNDQIGGPCSAASIVGFLLQRTTLTEGSGIVHFNSLPKVSWYEFSKCIFEEALNLKKIDAKPKVIPVDSDAFPVKAKRPINSCLYGDAVVADWRPDLVNLLGKLI